MKKGQLERDYAQVRLAGSLFVLCDCLPTCLAECLQK